MLFDYGVNMKNPLKETLEQLNNDPEVIKAGAIGTERQLTIDMIEEIIEEIKNDDWNIDSLETCQEIIKMIRVEEHWKKFR